MAKARTTKSMNVETFKNEVNSLLLNSVDSYDRERNGMCMALETMLHATGNYHGFTYLSAENMTRSAADPEHRKVPGIAYPNDDWTQAPTFPDPTRRRYY